MSYSPRGHKELNTTEHVPHSLALPGTGRCMKVGHSWLYHLGCPWTPEVATYSEMVGTSRGRDIVKDRGSMKKWGVG